MGCELSTLSRPLPGVIPTLGLRLARVSGYSANRGGGICFFPATPVLLSFTCSTSFISFTCNHIRTLFRTHAMEQAQPLSDQSLPHSFPCNGGGRVSSLLALSLATRHSPPLATFFCFQQLPTIKSCNPRLLITIQNARGVYPSDPYKVSKCCPPELI